MGSENSSDEDRCNSQMNSIVSEDLATYLESKPVTPKGNSLSIVQYKASENSSNEDRSNSQMSSIVSEDLATYLGNDMEIDITEHDDIELKSDTDISIGE